jgi:hypothetical protein
MTYRLEGTIQNNTIWIDKHKQISLKYDIPTGGYFNGTFCVYLSRLCYFVLSPPVGMSCFNEIFCVYLSRLCNFVFKHKKSHENMTYQLEGTIQNNTIWIDKHKKSH